MTDRELLEMAAKAAGIELDWDVPTGASPWRMTGTPGDDDYGPADIWNPLTDDGDAFRLAVKLKASIHTDIPHCSIWIHKDFHVNGGAEPGDDMEEANRRSIVLAAADLAMEMKARE